MKSNQLFLLISLVLLLLSACEKVITIKSPGYENKLSIQGIMELDSFGKVFIYETVPFFGNLTSASSLFARNAIVTITSVDGIDSLNIDSTYDHFKCEYIPYYQGKIKARKNVTYNLNINYRGKNYNANTIIDLKPVKIDSVSFTSVFKDVYGEHEGVIVDFKDDAATKDYYRFEMFRPIDGGTLSSVNKTSSPCIGNDTINIFEYGRSVYDDQNTNGQNIRLVIEPGYSHVKGISTKIRIQTVDKLTYEFYDQLDRQKLGQKNPFVEPTFIRSTQFGDNVFGYFGAMVKSQPIDFIFPE